MQCLVSMLLLGNTALLPYVEFDKVCTPYNFPKTFVDLNLCIIIIQFKWKRLRKQLENLSENYQKCNSYYYCENGIYAFNVNIN